MRVLTLRVSQQFTSMPLCHHAKPNGLPQTGSGFHRGSKIAMSNFGAIANFGILADFSKFDLAQQERPARSEAECLQIFDRSSSQAIAKLSSPTREAPWQKNFGAKSDKKFFFKKSTFF